VCLLLVVASVLPPAVKGVSSSVVISEFRVRGPVGGSDEFVEIFNLSASPVDISGWKIRGSNSAGTISTRATVPAGTVLAPGCYFLFTNSSASGGPYSGPVPGNVTYATGITDDGGLALTLPSDVVVDAAGMSAGSAFKEGTPLAALGTSNQNRGYERLPGGAAGNGQDTDNNAGDFALISPSTPQNAASPCVNVNPTNPTGSGAAAPNSLAHGDSTVLTVNVTPGSNPASTNLAVVADLTAIGGSAAQSFYDDGIQGGDAIPNDRIFTFTSTIGGATTPGNVSLPVTISDAQARSGTSKIDLTVIPPVTPIHTLQGSGDVSPFDGQLVRTSGVVTALKSNGFFLQTPDAGADADPATSQGIFVFTGITPPLPAAVGNLVEVSGNLQEFRPGSDPFSPPMTEITAPAVVVISTGNPLPAPITLTTAHTLPSGGLNQLEKYEGMRVYVGALTTTSPTLGSVSEANATGNSNGVFYAVIKGLARPFREAGIHILDPLPAGTPCCIPRWDGNPELLRVDSDGQTGAARIEVNSGATVSNVTAVLDFGFRAYTLLPDPGTAPGVSGLTDVSALPAPAANEFTVTTMNLERFFDTVNDPGISDVALSPAAFATRLHKVSLAIRNVMRMPDIIGVQEMENLSTLQAVADKINNDAVAAGQPNPLYVPYLEEGNDIGGIDVGFLVKSSRVTVVTVTQVGKFDTYIDPNSNQPEILNDRPPLVLEAIIQSSSGPNLPVTVIVNHLRSLNGVDDAVDGNRVRTKRASQAEFLAAYVQQRQAANFREEIILLGDFNAFQLNDGYVDLIGTIKGTPTAANKVVKASPDLVNPNLANFVNEFKAADRYSFVFDGNAQVLDHVIITGRMFPRATRFFFARNNADYPESLRGDGTRSERYSDHDHLVVYFKLPLPGQD
jgi:hypothetical protein